MKKVAFLCCLFYGLITQAVGATYNCKPQSLGPLAFKSSNEYLFLGDSNYDNKIALVCGHKGTDGCEHGTMVEINGDFRIYNEFRSGNFMYECYTSGGSSWDAIDYSEKCSNTDGMVLGARFGIDKDNGYDLYVSDVDCETTDDGKTEFCVIKEYCFVAIKFTSRGDSSPATSEEKKTNTEKTGQDAKQKQPAQTKSGDAGKKADREWRAPCSKEDLLKVPHAKAGRYIFIWAYTY